MSQIENVITTTFRARGTQAIAEMGGYGRSIGNVGRAINETTRMSERLNNQWRAIGTTIRYAVAGGAIFGLTRMVSQLKDVQQQLGLIQAIGQPAGGGVMSTRAVDRLGNDLQKASLRALTPINEINDATINLLSTVQNVNQSEVSGMIQDIAQAAKLAQTPVEDLTKAATTMNIAFGRPNNRSTLGEFNRQWFALIKEAPGGVSAAPQIAQQLPQLASMFALGRGPVSGAESQRQMLAMVLGVLRTGSTPSTGLRGLTYLAQSIIQPTGKARGALAAIGITPQSIEKEGINANIMKLLNRITKTGNQKQIAAMPDDTLSALDESGGNLPGIPASEMTRLRQMIPRIHGIRAAVILAGQLKQQGQVLSLGQDLELMQQAQANQADQTHSLARAWKDFRNRSKLQEASVALNTMKLQVAQAFEPILNFAAGGVSGLTNQMQHHRTATRAVALGGGAMLAALGVSRFLGLGKRAGSALVRTNAVEAAMTPGGVLGDSPQNPLYVVVVGQLFNPKTSSITDPLNPSSRGNFISNTLKSFGVGLVAAHAGKIVSAAKGGLRGVETLGAEAPMLPDVWNWIANGVDPTTGQKVGGSAWKRLLPVQQGNFKTWQDYHQALARTQKMVSPDVTNIESFTQGKLKGQAEIFMTLDLNHPDGTKERRRVHIPVDLWTGGRVPSSRGKAANTQRGK